MANGDTAITEINGDWLDIVAPDGRALTATHPPGFTYPSDTNEVSPGLFLSVDYTDPGAIETFTSRWPAALALRAHRGRSARPAFSGAAAAERRHPRQRRQERPRDRRRPAHEQDRLAVRPHPRSRLAGRISEQPRRRGPRATVLARATLRRHDARAMSRQDSTHGSFPGLRATASARGGRSAEHRRARRRLKRRKAMRRRRQAAALALITAIALAASVLSGAWSSSGRAGLASKTTRPAATPIRVARASPTGPRRQAATRQAARAGPTGPRRQVATRQVARSAPSPGSLPQTHAFPSADSPRFKSLMGSLWAGIVHDSVEQALPAFFPKQAYLQLKAIAGAGADWTDRLVHDYSLDIAAAHALLGRDPQRARLVRVEVELELWALDRTRGLLQRHRLLRDAKRPCPLQRERSAPIVRNRLDDLLARRVVRRSSWCGASVFRRRSSRRTGAGIGRLGLLRDLLDPGDERFLTRRLAAR